LAFHHSGERAAPPSGTQGTSGYDHFGFLKLIDKQQSLNNKSTNIRCALMQINLKLKGNVHMTKALCRD